MRVLVTGASGLIGFSLLKQLSEKYGQENIQLIEWDTHRSSVESARHHQLIGAGYDIIMHDLLDDGLNRILVKPFDILFHLAAFTESECNSPLVRVNDVGTEKLLSALKPLLPGKRVVYTGSMASVDRTYPDNTPQAEEYPCRPRIPYARTKLDGERILQRHARDTGFEWTILRLPTIYGPGYRPGGMFSILEKSLREGTLTARIAWPGRMSLLYVNDAVDLLIRLGTEKTGKNALYHASSGEDPRYDELITLIARLLGLRRKRIPLPKTFWSVLARAVYLPGLLSVLPFKVRIAAWRVSLIVMDGMVADSSRLDAAFAPRYTPLEEGLAHTYGLK